MYEYGQSGMDGETDIHNANLKM